MIDEIALSVAEFDPEGDLETLITSKTMDYMVRLRHLQPSLSEQEIDRVTITIVTGVLKRLAQIAESGGQIGSA